jgi:hypothetical protein
MLERKNKVHANVCGMLSTHLNILSEVLMYSTVGVIKNAPLLKNYSELW